MRFDPVGPSAELSRILALPRRTTPESYWEQVAREWSWALLNDAGRRELLRIEALPPDQQEEAFYKHAIQHRPLVLSGLQVQLLSEATQMRGLCALASVGAGKTLISWLIPLMIGAKRPAVFVPGGLVDDTLHKFAEIQKFWTTPNPPPLIISIDGLSQMDNADSLCQCSKCTGAAVDKPGGLRPDCGIVDESDVLRSKKSARTKRYVRYATNHITEVNNFFLTATAFRKSIDDWAPHVMLALKDKAPIPLTWQDREAFKDAIDAKSKGVNRPPGALLQMCTPEILAKHSTPQGVLDQTSAVRAGFQNRLINTPGIVVSTKQSCNKPLHIRYLTAPEDPEIDKAFDDFRETQATPDGWDVDDPLSALRYGTELGCGFYYRWDPRPPDWWLEARHEASVFVREAIANSGRRGKPLDTCGQVYRSYPNERVLLHWKETEPKFVPNVVAVPVSSSVLGFACDWLRQNGPALVWVQHSYIGEALSKMSGIPYFEAKGKDKTRKRYIGNYDPEQSAIISLSANKRGRNLQAYNRALIIGPTPTATDWEQGYLGRMHRQGQMRSVHVDVLLSCGENVRAVDQAREEAGWVHEASSHKQKLLLAQHDWGAFDATRLQLPFEHPARSRWTCSSMPKSVPALCA